MKPNKEIIDLARQLHNLGVKKEPEEGDWYTMFDSGITHMASPVNLGLIVKYRHFIIPPLEWCLEWLREAKAAPVLYGWPFHWDVLYNDADYATDENLYLAVLKAMVGVKTAESKQLDTP